MQKLAILLSLAICSFLGAEEEPSLTHIEQLTFPSMGFARAGEAYFSPDNSSILFQAVPEGESEYQIYRMDLCERVPHLVSTGKGACTCAFFHPDGNKIIFASSHEDQGPKEIEKEDGKYQWDFTPYMNIYEANRDGTDLKALTFGPAYHAECAYSPDGKQIVYASNENRSMNLYIMDSDGSRAVQITNTSHCYNGGPFFSPDGKKLIFRADRRQENELEIYQIDADGSNEKQLTQDCAVNWAPYWHPNGQLIAYTTSRFSIGAHTYAIELMDVETLARQQLTFQSSFDGLPVFSHDGKKLLWTSKRGACNSCQIFIADFSIPELKRWR
jgi:TolB protein